MALDGEFFSEGRRRLTAALLADTLDAMGLPAQAMDAGLRPLDDASVLFGRARTGQYVDRFERLEGGNPYAVEIALVDNLQPDDVAVLNGGGTRRYAAWGELLTAAAKARGAAGAVVDGQSRDSRLVRASGLPVFVRSIGMLDAWGRGEMVARDLPVACGGVRVAPGDLIFGDADGVLAIPAEAAEEAVRRALEKAAGERQTLRALEAGEPLGQVFERFRIL